MSFVEQEPAQNGQAGCKALEGWKVIRILDGSVFVCEELGKVLLRIPEGIGTAWEN